MKVLLVSSEAAPYAKTGGLADVIGPYLGFNTPFFRIWLIFLTD